MVGRPRLSRPGASAESLEIGDHPSGGRPRRADAPRGRQAGSGRHVGNRSRRRADRMGCRPRRQGAGTPAGQAGAADAEPGGHRGVPALRRRRGHRSVELPGLHPNGIAGLCPGGRQRGRVQAESLHTGGRPVAGRALRRSGPGAPGALPGHRGRRHRDGAVPGRCGQARVHRLHRHRQEGHGRMRGDAHPGAARMRRQGRPRRGFRRGRRGCRGRRTVGGDVQLRADLHRHRTGVRGGRGVRRVRPCPGRPRSPRPARSRAGCGLRPDDHPPAARRRTPACR